MWAFRDEADIKENEGVSAVCIPELPSSNVAAKIELHQVDGV
jgi:hypothetical protein